MAAKKYLAGVALLIILALSACGLYRDDRMYITDMKYEKARAVYDETGSLALTEKRLRESHEWQRGEINEAMYRLRKQYRLEQNRLD